MGASQFRLLRKVDPLTYIFWKISPQVEKYQLLATTKGKNNIYQCDLLNLIKDKYTIGIIMNVGHDCYICLSQNKLQKEIIKLKLG